MHMKIYLDLLFIQDFIMMSILLLLISKIIEIKIKIDRVLTVSMVCSILSIMILVFLPTFYDNLFIKLVISFFIVKYGLNITDTISIIQKVILFWLISSFIGGSNIAFDGNVFYIIIISLIGTATIIAYKKKYKKQLFLESATCFIEFFYNENWYRFKALVDTGHDVKSIYGEDVIFIRAELIEKGGERKKRLVSYKTISGTENKYGIKINNIVISYRNINICKDAVIITTNNISQDFDAIIGYDLIEGGITYGNSIFNETKSKETIH